MSMELKAAMSELEFMQMEIESLEVALSDPEESPLLKYEINIRLTVLRNGKLWVEKLYWSNW